MKFQANAAEVIISNEGNEFRCSLADFLLMEPGYSLPDGATELWDSDRHCYLIGGDQLPAASAAATYPAKIAAYTSALAQLHPPPLAPGPTARDFRVALLADPLFTEWQENLPAIARENLKLAAIADDWETCQTIYSQLASVLALPDGAAAQWQALADASGVPIKF